MQRVGRSDQFENLIADVEFGLAKEGAFLGGDESPGDGEEVIAGLLFHLAGELLSLVFLFGGQGNQHGGSSRASDLISIVLNHVELYRSCTNSGAAYPWSVRLVN